MEEEKLMKFQWPTEKFEFLPEESKKPNDGSSTTGEKPLKCREERIRELVKDAEDVHKKTISELLEAHKEIDQLQKSLRDADVLLSVVLDQNTTLTTLNYLRAVHRGESSDVLKALHKTACDEKEITDILVSGSAFRGNTATSHHDILTLAGFVKNLQITDRFDTRTYAKVVVPGTPPKELKEYQKIVEERNDRKKDETKKKLDF